jgi:hypothetical protein
MVPGHATAGQTPKEALMPPDTTPYRLIDLREGAAWDVVAHRGDSVLADARDRHASEDLLCALMLRLYPDGTTG